MTRHRRMTAAELTRRLRAAGVEVLGFGERTGEADAGVDLPGGRDVQIETGGRLVLNQWVEDDESSWELGTYRTPEELIDALKRNEF